MIEKAISNHNAVFFLLAGAFLLFGMIRQIEGDRLRLFLRSFTNPNLIDQQLRQERAFSRLALLSFILIISVLSIFLTVTFDAFHLFEDFSTLGLFLSVFIFLVLLTTGRVAIYSVLSWVFELELLQQHHTFHWLLINLILSLILLPTAALLTYGPETIALPCAYFGLALMLLFYLIRVVRLVLVSANSFRVSIAYNFLYICALEILPLAIAISVVSRQIQG